MRLVIIFILALALLSCRRDANKLTILFDNAEGLENGGEVYYKGIKVGEVVLSIIVGKISYCYERRPYTKLCN